MLGLLWGDWVEPFASQTMGRLGKINPIAKRKYPPYPERSVNAQSEAVLPRATKKSEPPDKGSSEELFGQTTVIGNLLLNLANVNKTILS